METLNYKKGQFACASRNRIFYRPSIRLPAKLIENTLGGNAFVCFFV